MGREAFLASRIMHLRHPTTNSYHDLGRKENFRHIPRHGWDFMMIMNIANQRYTSYSIQIAVCIWHIPRGWVCTVKWMASMLLPLLVFRSHFLLDSPPKEEGTPA
jgi:hypothetical protein